MKLKRSFVIAAVLAVAAVGWILSGQIGEERAAEAQKPPAQLSAAKQVPTVRVRHQSAEPRTAALVLRGRSEALRTVDIKAETHGRTEELLFERGDQVQAGDLLVHLSDEGRSAAVKEAKALLAQRRIELEAARKLSKKGFRAETQLAESEAAYEAAEAAVSRAEVALDDTRILAPFAGYVDDRMTELGAYVEPGDPIARIVDLDPILIVANASEIDVASLKVGGAGKIRFISGQEASGHIRFVGAMADPQTRTFRVEIEVPNADGAIPDGVSAEVSMPLDEVWAHRVSPAVLSLSDTGVLGVKTVDGETNAVRFQPVEIVDNGPGGVWLAGLPREVTVITVGQEFVVDGQTVQPVDEESLRQEAQEAEDSAS